MRSLAALVIIFLSVTDAVAAKLLFPLDCSLGRNCWISNLPRHFHRDQQVDYRCGSNTYPGHKGTDFALRDYKQMDKGVAVLAPINGTIKALRDNMPDVDVTKQGMENKVQGKECGNGIIIADKELEVQLCHLKRNSTRVKVGDVVKAGANLAEVGLSGMTQYPHLHIGVRKKIGDKMIELDPFYGNQDGCGLKPKSWWIDPELFEHNAKTGIVYNYGFTFEKPDPNKVRKGLYDDKSLPGKARVLVAFADIFSVNKGDKIILIIKDKEKNIFTKGIYNIAKYQARYFIFTGRKLSGKISDKYYMEIIYQHEDGRVSNYSKSISS